VLLIYCIIGILWASFCQYQACVQHYLKDYSIIKWILGFIFGIIANSIGWPISMAICIYGMKKGTIKVVWKKGE
jgi:hypothetical protein